MEVRQPRAASNIGLDPGQLALKLALLDPRNVGRHRAVHGEFCPADSLPLDAVPAPGSGPPPVVSRLIESPKSLG